MSRRRVSALPVPRSQRKVVPLPVARRAAAIFQNGWKVMVPRERRRDGAWSGVEKVVAVFLKRKDAEEYARGIKGNGMPVRLVKGKG